MDATSSQSIATSSSPLWDVFLSFYGKDTRKGFVSNLYHALDQAGIVTFRDEPALEKGEEISPGLQHAINNSKMFVVVISENYAYSSWCLDELVEILLCNTTKKQVIPVFYYVNPSDLRHQNGRFGEALKKHEARYSLTTIDKWKHALTEIANLSGYHLLHYLLTHERRQHIYKLRITFVTYAGGLPLALKVLGSSLCSRIDMSFWKAKLEKIQKIPVKDIQKVLQLSYDELDDEKQKAIFLDIVFFFVGKNIDEAVHVFESCGFFPDEGIPILVERCLITIDENNNLQMHDLIQDMGRKVEHGKCRHLCFKQEEACEALHNIEGMDKIEGLILDFRPSTNKYCNAKIFKKLPKLRLLKLIDVHNIEGNFKSSFHKLRYISDPI